MPHIDKTRAPLIDVETAGKSVSIDIVQPPLVDDFVDKKNSGEIIPQKVTPPAPPQQSSFSKKVVSLLIWFIFNSLTVILNKFLFVNIEFHYPLTLTAVHMATCSFFAFLLIFGLKRMPLIRLPMQVIVTKIIPLSFIFCINIVLGNIAIRWVPVSFMQTVKSSVPVFTVMLQYIWFRKVFPSKIYLALVPVVGGVALASFSEANFVLTGFICALIASVTTALQAIVVHMLVASGLKRMDPVNLLLYTSPICLALLIPTCVLFEFPAIRSEWIYYGEPGPIIWLIVSGSVAFFLNYASFIVSSVVDVLTMTVAGNFKAVINIVASVMIFGNAIGYVNWMGCIAATGGVMWYNHLMMNVKK